MVVNIFAAVGFTVTGIIIKGMILYGAWLFFLIAVIGVFMTIFNNIEERDAFFHIIKKFASISVAVLLFYIPVKVNLADVVAGAPKSDVSSAVSGNGLISSMANFSSGSSALVNAVTYYAYEWSSGLPALATEIAGTSSAYIWPGVESAIDADLSGAMQANDPQIAANMAQWKYILAPAILKSDPALASALQTNPMLQYVFENPYSTTATTDPRYGAYAAQVKSLLSSDQPKPTFQSIVLQNQAAFARIARKFGSVVPFTASPSSTVGASPSSVSVKLFSREFWKQNQKIDANNAANNIVSSTGASKIWSIIDWLPSLGERLMTTSAQRHQISTNDSATAVASNIAVDMADFFGGSQFNNPTQTFTSLGNLYQNLGRSVLVASVMGYADNPKAISAMEALCKTHGNAACAQTLQMFSNQQRRPDAAVGHTPGVSSWLGKTLSDLGSFTITGLIEVVIYSIGTIFNTAAPYIIAVSMTAAILVSVIGPIWMLMAGRFLHAIEWMVFPVILVNLWDALYIIWIIVCDALDDVIPHLAGTVNNGAPLGHNVGIVANPALMNHIVNIFEAMGFLAIPTAAYMLLFGKAADGLRSNFGSTMSRTIATAATLATMTAMRSMSKGGKKPSGKQTPGGKGITQGMATNAPSGGGGSTATAAESTATAAKAVGGAPAKGNAAHNISGTVAKNSAKPKTDSSGGPENGGTTESGGTLTTSEAKTNGGSNGAEQSAVTSNQVAASNQPSAQSSQSGGTANSSRGTSTGGQVSSSSQPATSNPPSVQISKTGGTANSSRSPTTGTDGQVASSSQPSAAGRQPAAQPYQQQRPSIRANQPKPASRKQARTPAATGRITGYNPKKSS
jgi:hypothetical protein